ncbi:MAG: glutaredoxin domain-containing protein [Porticoccaceae bacterium]
MRGIKILLALILGLVAYQWYASRVDVEKALSTPVVAHNELIMYSLTTCGYCKQKRRQLEAANIPFTEHFIDVDRQRQKELNEKLARSGHFARGYGTPILMPTVIYCRIIRQWLKSSR